MSYTLCLTGIIDIDNNNNDETDDTTPSFRVCTELGIRSNRREKVVSRCVMTHRGVSTETNTDKKPTICIWRGEARVLSRERRGRSHNVWEIQPRREGGAAVVEDPGWRLAGGWGGHWGQGPGGGHLPLPWPGHCHHRGVQGGKTEEWQTGDTIRWEPRRLVRSSQPHL